MSNKHADALRSDFGPFWDKIRPKKKGADVTMNGNAAVALRDHAREAADEIDRLESRIAELVKERDEAKAAYSKLASYVRYDKDLRTLVLGSKPRPSPSEEQP